MNDTEILEQLHMAEHSLLAVREHLVDHESDVDVTLIESELSKAQTALACLHDIQAPSPFVRAALGRINEFYGEAQSLAQAHRDRVLLALKQLERGPTAMRHYLAKNQIDARFVDRKL